MTRPRQNQIPLPNLHCHLEPWLFAAANNQLSPTQQLTLERHLCECPACIARSQNPEFVAKIADQLNTDGHLADDLQTRFVANFLDAVEKPPPPSRQRAASRLRLAIAVTLLLALSIRLADPALLDGLDVPSAWEAMHQLILHDPDYQQIQRTALIAAEDHLPLAALHKLANTLSATLAWLALFLVGRHSFVNLCRRHFLQQ